jgi:hypothetical protein
MKPSISAYAAALEACYKSVSTAEWRRALGLFQRMRGQYSMTELPYSKMIDILEAADDPEAQVVFIV